MAARSTIGAVVPALAALLAAGALASPAVARRLSDRPPPAHTGGFGEPTCTVCHADGAVDDERGSIALEGLPASYVPGERYVLTVSLAHPELRVGGFQLSARYAEGGKASLQAGVLRALDDRVDVTTPQELPVQYARQTAAGLIPAKADSKRIAWRVEWIAPSDGGSVVFHVAANVANDDSSPLGDLIYTRSFEGTMHRQ